MLKAVVFMLSQEPSLQEDYLRSLGGGITPDELALDFDDQIRIAVRLYNTGEITINAYSVLQKLNKKFNEFSGDPNESHWTIEALYNSSHWSDVRILATKFYETC